LVNLASDSVAPFTGGQHCTPQRRLQADSRVRQTTTVTRRRRPIFKC
jgi:hypothetical protein